MIGFCSSTLLKRHLDLQGGGVDQQPAPGQERVARAVVHQPPRQQRPARRCRAVEAQLQGETLQLLPLLHVANLNPELYGVPDAGVCLMTASFGDMASNSHRRRQAQRETLGMSWLDLTEQLAGQLATGGSNARQEYGEALKLSVRAPSSLQG